MASVCSDSLSQTVRKLVDCPIDNILAKVFPGIQQCLLQRLHRIVRFCIDLTLQKTPDRVGKGSKRKRKKIIKEKLYKEKIKFKIFQKKRYSNFAPPCKCVFAPQGGQGKIHVLSASNERGALSTERALMMFRRS